MGSRDYYKAGSVNVYCQQCGRKFKQDELRRQWDNLMVCVNCWEPRNAQELIRPIVERPPAWTRPKTDLFPLFQEGLDKYVIGGYMCCDAMMG